MGVKVGIVGGGASGLMAAVCAAACGASVTVLEGGRSVGKKLSLTGNGKGNYTNTVLSPDCYPACDASFLREAFSRFDQTDSLLFFKDLGIIPRLRNGYVYPRCEQAPMLARALREEAERLGARVLIEHKVSTVTKRPDGFSVTSAGRDFFFDRLILAAGGLTAPRTGSDGSGYTLARSLGHTVTRPVPALCGLQIKKGHPLLAAAGVRTEAAVTLYINGEKAAGESGELQITEQGISGIPVMQLSGKASRALAEGSSVQAVLDLMPEWDSREARQLLEQTGDPRGLFPDRLLAALPKERKALAEAAKHLRAEITGVRDAEHAQVTCGGVPTGEIDASSMSSLLCEGLYLTGETADVDGRCGGYNLQWAWTSGAIAGCHAAGSAYIHRQADSQLTDLLRRTELNERRK